MSTRFARIIGSQKGYTLFQEFAPNNEYDIRVITIGDRAFAIKRMVRSNDFRASRSGNILYDKNEIDERCVKIAFETSGKLRANCLAYDFVFDSRGNPFIVEINYGYDHCAYFSCKGFWDINMQWHECRFNSAEWMVHLMVNGRLE